MNEMASVFARWMIGSDGRPEILNKHRVHAAIETGMRRA